jgi:preprotein translocase subunit SecG
LQTKLSLLKNYKNKVKTKILNTFSIFIALIILVCILLVIVIMVQNPKGGGLSSSFGGGVQQMGGVKNTTDFLDKSTWVLGSLLLILILLSNFSLESKDNIINNESKLIDGIEQSIEEIPSEVLQEEIPETIELEETNN